MSIPEDVMEAAREAAIGCLNSSGLGDEDRYAEVIARAIMAERERCATVADDEPYSRPAEIAYIIRQGTA
mgnify:FL=1